MSAAHTTVIENDFLTTANSSKIMVWMSDAEMQCCFLNDKWLQFTGRTLEQDKGNGWTMNIHPADFVHCLQQYSSYFNQRKEFKIQYRLKRHDGAYCMVVSHGKPMYAEGGSFTGYVGSCIDIEGAV